MSPNFAQPCVSAAEQMNLLDTLVAQALPLIPKPLVRRVAWRYIAGTSLEDAVATVRRLAAIGATATIDALGEYVTTAEHAERETMHALQTLDAIAQHQLPAYLSVKLTSIGLSFDRGVAEANLQRILEQARRYGLFVRLDMENSPYTSATLDIYRTMREAGYDNIGVVIQAYLYRSEQDIYALAPYRADIRLCKGIYNEDASIAIKDREGIRTNYRKLLRVILDLGMSVRIATHDDVLIADAEQLIAERGLERERYEFQMLLGVREQKRDELIARGYPVRIYVPYGEDWYGYSLRRLRENPQVAGHVFRALIGLDGDSRP